MQETINKLEEQWNEVIKSKIPLISIEDENYSIAFNKTQAKFEVAYHDISADVEKGCDILDYYIEGLYESLLHL